MKTGIMISCLIVLCACLFTSAAAQGQTVFYVDRDAPPGGDGLTWDTAFDDLQDGLDAARDRTATEIRVGEGAYAPDGGSGDRTATFQMLSGVAVRGGYAGYGAPDPDERDIVAYETILSGDLLGNDDLDEFPDGPSFDDNSHHVVTTSDTDDTAVLDGLTITGGNATGDPSPSHGGGILNSEGSPTLLDCTIAYNRAMAKGAGMYSDGFSSDVALIRCTFDQNWARRDGGGLFNNDGASMSLTECSFADNASGRQGGGIYLSGGSETLATLSDCTFTGNTAETEGGAICADSHDNVHLTHCVFENNTTSASGGGLYAYDCALTMTACTFTMNTSVTNGGGASIESPNVALDQCSFSGNNSYDGAGLFLDTGINSTLTECSFTANTSTQYGGGLFLWGSPTLTDCLFYDNTVINNEPEHGAFGGGAFVAAGDHTMVGCVFAGNAASGGRTLNKGYGGGLYVGYGDTHLILSDCIFENNSASGGYGGGISAFAKAHVVLYNCLFHGNAATHGGGVAVLNESGLGGTLTMIDCTFVENVADEQGGGLDVKDGSPTVFNCLFIGNSATFFGGAAACRAAYWDGWPRFTNCTFTHNTVTDPEGIGGALFVAPNFEPTLQNCILWDNAAPYGHEIGLRGDEYWDARAIVTYCDVEGGEEAVFVGGNADLTWGDGNIDADPLFVDPDGPDGIPGTEDDDLHLLPDSPCIEAGDPDSVVDPDAPNDIDGEPRIMGCRVDIGADEFPDPHPLPGDLDGDGTVDPADIPLFVSALLGLGSPAAECLADLNADGTADGLDTQLLVDALLAP